MAGLFFAGGGDWIRTSVGVSQQIYSLPPLATRAPLLSESGIMPLFFRGQQVVRLKIAISQAFYVERPAKGSQRQNARIPKKAMGA